MNEANRMVKLAVEALEEKKAHDVSVLDISGVATFADYFVIASGDNERQVGALTDSVGEVLGRAGFTQRALEGYSTKTWVLMDFNDVIIHIFNKKDRAFYDLDRIWRDAKKVDVKELED